MSFHTLTSSIKPSKNSPGVPELGRIPIAKGAVVSEIEVAVPVKSVAVLETPFLYMIQVFAETSRATAT